MAVSKRTRYEVLARDDFTCRYCNATDVRLTVDHVVPLALGGTDKPDNLVTACWDCNAGKASTSPTAQAVEQVADDAERWASALRKAADVLAAEQSVLDDYKSAFIGSWPGYLPSDWESSIEALFKAGLPEDMLREAASIATCARGVQTSRFRYFCGVAWRRVARMQEVARELLDAEEQQ